MDTKPFTAQRTSHTESILLHGSIEKVFLLFGAFEEKKWADGWNPVVLYPLSETMEEGMVFKTRGHGHDETEFHWIVSKYQTENHLIEYIVSTVNRCWVITITCTRSSDTETQATITYAYTGLNALGNEINKRAIEHIYDKNLKDWEEAINYYLKTGNMLKHQ